MRWSKVLRADNLQSILEPPSTCHQTIRGIDQLVALDNALNRSGIWPALDHAKNVTCLGPNTDAFKAAGNADQNLDQNELINALQLHTLEQPLYTNYLTDGQTVSSANNVTVTIYIRGADMYFNDAKIVLANVL
jgi:uncharacterized surface protein with fasciclin (FAS1) repeats